MLSGICLCFIGPALVTTKDAGDAVTLLQSLAGSTFDSSQLVLTACMGYQAINEARLQKLREKHRPAVLAIVEERASGLRVSKGSKRLASKLYSFKHDPGSLIPEKNPTEGSAYMHEDGDLNISESDSSNVDEFLSGMTGDCDTESGEDLQEQVLYSFIFSHFHYCLCFLCYPFHKWKIFVFGCGS